MNIEWKPVEELVPYANNPRVNDKAVEPVAKSIQEFGFKTPILLDKNNVIIAGHTRLKAAKKLGMDKVPCIICDDLSPEQAKALRLVDNKTAEFADWDFSLLNEELKNIDLPEINLEEFGFAENDVSDIFDKEVYMDSSPKPGNEGPKFYTIKCPCCGQEFEVKEDELK